MQTAVLSIPIRRPLTLLLLIAFVLASFWPTVSYAQSNSVNVQRFEFPVVLSDNLVGYLYTRQGNPNDTEQCGKRSNTLQVALHGGTYNHKYWDAGVVNGVDYSYANYMAGQCYSVLALDRLGTGESSKPSGDFINLAVEADSISQILSSLRTNRNPIHKKFKRIVLVGHSFGSLLSIFTLGEYGNVADGLVATGWINAPGSTPLTEEIVGPLLGSAEINAPSQLRAALFYDQFTSANYDPDVVNHDNENLIDILPRAFFLDGIAIFTARTLEDVAQIKALTHSDQVNVPVFVQTGDHDVLFPTLFVGPEASFYSNAPSVTIDDLSNIAHGFNTHLGHLTGWQHIADWINQVIVNG